MSNITKKTSRQAFGHVQSHVQMPDLLAIQINSYEEFLQEDVLVEKRRNQGLEQVFSSMFPVFMLKTYIYIKNLYIIYIH